jgi:CRP-like cAMP-binding protein
MSQAAKPLAVSTAPQSRRLKKGEILFAEGEGSRSMYLLKTGMIRIFKKKGDSNIEIDTIRAGQIVGELAFLDGNPRSASGEALTDCDLLEISAVTFQEVFTNMPEWLKILLKTVVGRLRTASTRIRQLETASSAFDYSERDGKRTAHYVYLSPPDVLKVLTGILLVGSHHGTAVDESRDIQIHLLQKYVNQILGIPVAKITTMLDVLSQSGLLAMSEEETGTRAIFKDITFLEKLIHFLNEENLAEPGKRRDLTPRGFLMMSLIAKYISRFPVDETTGFSLVNIAEIKKAEMTAAGKDPFRIEEFNELVKMNYIGVPRVQSSDDVVTIVRAQEFLISFKMQRIVIAIAAVNDAKQKSVGAK